jgi:CxxC motif-containing protein
MLLELAAASRKIELEAPVRVGDVVLKNWKGMDIDLVASGEVTREEGR